jgi:hypothetical protein
MYDDEDQPKSLRGRPSEALTSFRTAPTGTHCLMIYPDLTTLRRMYSHYTKTLLEDYNEIVLILPYYETTDMVRLTLSGRNVYSGNRDHPFGYSGINVNKYEKEGALIIMDSLKGYFPSGDQSGFLDNFDRHRGNLDFMSYLKILLKQAERQKKNGVTVLSDIGSFYHHNNPEGNLKLIQHECSLPKKFEKNLKVFCLYHQKDFENKFSQEQQAELLNCHSRDIMVEK